MPGSETGRPNEYKESNPAFSDEKRLRDLIMGFRTTQLIATAARLNLAGVLKDGPLSSGQLAVLTGTDETGMYRLLRALASLEILEAEENFVFRLSSFGRFLCDDAQRSLKDIAILYGEKWLWEVYAQLSYSVEKGKPAFEYVHGLTLYDYLKQNTSASEKFNKAMTAYSKQEAAAIGNAYDFSAAGTIVDVGGGQGALVLSLLGKNPRLTGIVYDLPAVIEAIDHNRIAGEKGLQIRYVAGDFFREVPEGSDVYLFKSILHNWDDPSCISILRTCHKAMYEKARLLIIERVIPGQGGRPEAVLFDINMLVMTGGQERTEEEYRKLLDAAGFELQRVISTESGMSIIESTRR